MDIIISQANSAEAEQIQQVFYLTWLDTYPNEEYGITREMIEKRFAPRLTKEGVAKFAEKIAQPEPNTLFLIAKQEEKIIGVCRVRKDDKQNQLGAIYVLPEYQRSGAGGRLWQEAKKFFDPDKDIIVNVAVYNDKAIGFYKKLGFVDTGKRFSEELFKLADDITIPEMEMVIKA